MSIKIAITSDRSGWVLDQIASDYRCLTKHNVVRLENDPDLFWAINPWNFTNIVNRAKCPLFFSLHHISEKKIQLYPMNEFNKFAVGCIVPNKKTEQVACKYVHVPIYRFPYWLLSARMLPPKSDPIIFRNEISSRDEILIGSFQKDSEGNSNKPKLEKGPDVFLNIVVELSKKHNLKIILAGYARKYIMENLKAKGIPFIYFERHKDLNMLYDCLDWYFVTSRTEGGPQAVLECSYRKVKILSTDVGIASEVLHDDCICYSESDFINKFELNTDKRFENYNSVINSYLHTTVIPKIDAFFEKHRRIK